MIAVLLTGAGFTFVKTTAAGSDLASATWSAVAGTSYLRTDPSDLLALPALLVALRVHRLASREHPALRQRAMASTGALVLPFAVLATAATSPCDDGAWPRDIVVLDGLWRGPDGGRVQDQRLAYDHGWYELRVEGDGVAVRRLRQSEHARIDEDAMLEVDSGTAACDPTRPRLCWWSSDPDADAGERPDPTAVDEVLVWASTDGGETWATEVVLDSATVDRMREEAGEICGKPLRLSPGLMAVLPTDEGPVVAVTMESAGVAVRGVDGRWRWLPRTAIEAAGERAAARDRPASSPTSTADRPPRHPLTPLEPVRPDFGQDAVEEPSPEPSPEPATPSPPCDDPVPVTVTPDPRNGRPTTELRCPASAYR